MNILDTGRGNKQWERATAVNVLLDALKVVQAYHGALMVAIDIAQRGADEMYGILKLMDDLPGLLNTVKEDAMGLNELQRLLSD